MTEPLALPTDHERRYAVGERLFVAGQTGTEIFVVCEGLVRLSRRVGGQELTVTQAGPGEFVGEEGLLGRARTTTAVAIETTRALLIDGPALETMLNDDAAIAVELVRGLLTKIGEYEDRLALFTRPPDARLAHAIARLTESLGQPDVGGTLLPRRLRELACEIGLDEVTLGEAAKTLVKARLMRIKKNGIVVPSIARMYEFAQALDALASPNLVQKAVRNHGA